MNIYTTRSHFPPSKSMHRALKRVQPTFHLHPPIFTSTPCPSYPFVHSHRTHPSPPKTFTSSTRTRTVPIPTATMYVSIYRVYVCTSMHTYIRDGPPSRLPLHLHAHPLFLPLRPREHQTTLFAARRSASLRWVWIPVCRVGWWMAGGWLGDGYLCVWMWMWM